MGSGTESRPKTNLVHSKAARKPLVAITLNILSTKFYVFEEINWRWCRHNTVQLSHIGSAVSDSVSPSPGGGDGRSRLGPPINLSLSSVNIDTHLMCGNDFSC